MRARHTLSVLVENKPGVLQRISGLFGRRGFNIHSLAVGTTEDPTLSRMTIVVSAEDAPLEQITKQLHKLINVIKIQDLDPAEMVDRELVLYKVTASPEKRAELIELANIFRARIVDVGRNSLTIEATGTCLARARCSASRRSAKFCTVDDAVKVSRSSPSARACCSFPAASSGGALA